MTVKTIERRGSLLVEVRADGETVSVVGHAAVFNEEAEIGNYFREIIRPGAFSRAILEDDVPLLIEHEGLPIARNKSGTLKLSEDAKGLRIESQLDADDPDVLRIIPKMKRGDLSKMSFAFMAIRHEWQDEDKPMPLRVLHECRLYDVSIVTTPAYDGTDVGMRSLEQWRADQEAERRRRNFRAASMRLRLKKSLDLRARPIAGTDQRASSETKYKVGDKIRVKDGKEHDKMAMGVGTVQEISSSALGIKFEGMDDIHKWYVDAEVEPAED